MPHPVKPNDYFFAAASPTNAKVLEAQTALSVIHHPTDQTDYNDLAEESSIACELNCLQTAHLAWDKALNQNYQSLLKTLSKAHKAALQQAQREWLSFRNAEWESLDKRYADKEGTIYQVFHTARRMEFTKQRARQLRDYQPLLKN